MQCIVLLPDISSRSLQFIYCMTKASFVTTLNTAADWMSVASGDLDKINSLEDHSFSSVSERNIHREIN